MRELEKILEEFGSYICDDLCYYRETSADKKDDEMEEICAGCKVGEYLESICKHMNDGWIPVEERMPEVGEYVLGTTKLGEVLIFRYGWNSPHSKKMFFHLCGAAATITAWRPLPEPYRPANKTEAPDWREDMGKRKDE